MRNWVLLFLVSVLLVGPASAQDWNQQTVDNAADVGQYSAIAHDAAGNPHIVYLDRTNARYMYTYYDQTVGAWRKQELFVNYQDYFQNQYIYVSTGWMDLGPAAAIAIDSNDKVYIVTTVVDKNDYYSNFYLNTYLFSGQAGGSLVKSTIFANDTGRYAGGYSGPFFYGPSIAVTTGSAYVAFYDGSTNRFRCFKSQGGGWGENPIDDSPNVGTHSDLAFSPAGDIYCSYSVDSGHMIRLGFQDGSGTWFSIPIDPTSTLDVYSAVAVDDDETVHVAYHDVNQGLKHAAVTRAKLMAYAAVHAKPVPQPTQDMGQ